MASEEQEIQHRIESLWARVKLDWENEELHQQFIDFCSTNNLLHLAAGKYQTHKREKGSSPLLEKYMQQITLIAQYKVTPNGGKKEKEKAGFLSRLFSLPNIVLFSGVTLSLYSLTTSRVIIILTVGLLFLILGGYLTFRNVSRKLSSRE